jgi:hypothetical protein
MILGARKGSARELGLKKTTCAWLLISALACGCVPAIPPATEPGLLMCRGSFGQFAHNRLIAQPSQLNFVIDWRVPAISTDNGRPGVIVTLDPYAIVFDITYDDYRTRYHINRIDGTIQQMTPLSGVFAGVCALSLLQTRF